MDDVREWKLTYYAGEIRRYRAQARMFEDDPTRARFAFLCLVRHRRAWRYYYTRGGHICAS